MKKQFPIDLNHIKNHIEPAELFTALFQCLVGSFSLEYSALFVFDKNSLFYCRQQNLDRESFQLRTPEHLPRLKKLFEKCSPEGEIRYIEEADDLLREPFAVRFSRVHIYPVCQGKTVIGGIILPFTEGINRASLKHLPLFLGDVSSLLSRKALFADDINLLKNSLQGRCAFGSLIGKSPAMQDVYEMVQEISGTDITVLIQGETGTGKELLATTIHGKSQRRNGPFIRAFCSAYTSTLMQSELFGHEKGAFTGAFKKKKGRFELADDGTLFLDEIGEINEVTQVLLLRFLETREFERVGGEETLKSNARIITATNRDLQEMVRKKIFREDLFFRLNMITITMPPLREKIDDIPLLTRHLLHQFCQESGKMVTGLSPEAMTIFLQYDWPGNVRELKGVLERGFHLTKHERIEVEHLPPHLLTPGKPKSGNEPNSHKHEKEIILEILEECRGNKKAAAEMLGISRPTLYQRLKRFGLMQ